MAKTHKAAPPVSTRVVAQGVAVVAVHDMVLTTPELRELPLVVESTRKLAMTILPAPERGGDGRVWVSPEEMVRRLQGRYEMDAANFRKWVQRKLLLRAHRRQKEGADPEVYEWDLFGTLNWFETSTDRGPRKKP